MSNIFKILLYQMSLALSVFALNGIKCKIDHDEYGTLTDYYVYSDCLAYDSGYILVSDNAPLYFDVNNIDSNCQIRIRENNGDTKGWLSINAGSNRYFINSNTPSTFVCNYNKSTNDFTFNVYGNPIYVGDTLYEYCGRTSYYLMNGKYNSNFKLHCSFFRENSLIKQN